MKPTLKKVSKYENKFAKLQKKAAEFNFRNQLKQVKKKEFTLEEEDKEVRTIVFGSSRLIDAIFYTILSFSLPKVCRGVLRICRNEKDFRRNTNTFRHHVINFFYLL